MRQLSLKRFSWLVALVVVPALLFTAGCDSGDVDDPEPPGPDPAPEPTAPTLSVNYDTTGSTITVTEQDGEGILPIDEAGDEIDDDGEESSVTWSSDYTYLLNGRIYVNEGQTLNIEPGTVIEATSDIDPENTGTLLVARGATINAAGTADEPIIFTAEGDDPSSVSTGSFSNRGFWGGVLILGTAPNNLSSSGDGSGTNTIEGFTEDPRATYGCGDEFDCDPDDDSGTFTYVSIRYGGFELSPGNEIQSLTLGSVGAGTEIHHIEALSNLDDGYEWFGGTVNMTHLIAAFVGDDSFDIDQGFNGGLQYLLAVQGYGGGDRAGEHDGGDGDFGGEDSTPLANSQVCNATYIGFDNGDVALKLRDSWAGSYYNSIFTNFPTGVVELENPDNAGVTDTYDRFVDGGVRIENNLAFGFSDADGNSASAWSDLVENDGDVGADIAEYMENNNTLLEGGLDGFSLSFDDEDGQLTSIDVTPASGSEAFDDADGSNCLEDTDFKGAFDGNDNWADGWTALSQAGFLE